MQKKYFNIADKWYKILKLKLYIVIKFLVPQVVKLNPKYLFFKLPLRRSVLSALKTNHIELENYFFRKKNYISDTSYTILKLKLQIIKFLVPRSIKLKPKYLIFQTAYPERAHVRCALSALKTNHIEFEKYLFKKKIILISPINGVRFQN